MKINKPDQYQLSLCPTEGQLQEGEWPQDPQATLQPDTGYYK